MRAYIRTTLGMLVFISAISGNATAQLRQKTQTKAEPTVTPLAIDEDLVLKTMPLRTKIGQMLMIGFKGESISEGLGQTLKALRPGGIIVFGRNIQTARQISNLNLAAQKISLEASHVPLLIATDQEGGAVTRLKTRIPLPSAVAFGSVDDISLLERAGKATGFLLKTLGFNMNLAPVLDVADPTKRTFIGTRTYGNDPELVANLGLTFAEGLKQAGILPTTKHFPGHGNLATDTHVSITRNPANYDQLRSHDLVPFYAQAKELRDASAVMVAHIAYPSLDPTGVPATFSKLIITDHLRGKIGFSGIVVTDDLEMAGASLITDPGERAVRSVEAGVDMIMVAWNRAHQAKVVTSIMSAVESGRLSQARIDESVRRILVTKKRFAHADLTPPTKEAVRLALRNPEFMLIGNAIVSRNMKKAVAAYDLRFTGEASDRPVFVFSASDQFYRTFKEAMAPRRTQHFRLGENQGFDVDKVMRSNPKAAAVFFVSGQRVAKIVNGISAEAAKRVLLVNVEAQSAIKNPDAFAQVADVQYRHPELGRLTAEEFFKAAVRAPAAEKQKDSLSSSSQPGEAPASSSSTSPATGAL